MRRALLLSFALVLPAAVRAQTAPDPQPAASAPDPAASSLSPATQQDVTILRDVLIAATLFGAGVFGYRQGRAGG